MDGLKEIAQLIRNKLEKRGFDLTPGRGRRKSYAKTLKDFVNAKEKSDTYYHQLILLVREKKLPNKDILLLEMCRDLGFSLIQMEFILLLAHHYRMPEEFRYLLIPSLRRVLERDKREQIQEQKLRLQRL